MKIAQKDKDLAIEKITDTLVKAAIEELPYKPKDLLVELYVDWFHREITPHARHPLYQHLVQRGSLSIVSSPTLHKFTNTRYRSGDIPKSTNLTAVEKISSVDLPTGIPLIQVNLNLKNRYTYEMYMVDNMPPAIQAKFQAYEEVLVKAREGIIEELEKLKRVLNQASTYKRLQDQYPLIFNALHPDSKAKYQKYRDRLRSKPKKSKVSGELVFSDQEDLASMGATLAIQELKKQAS